MNKFFKVLICFVSVIVIIFSFLLIIIEGRLLFSLDWIVYDSPFNGFIRYLLRLLIALFALIKSLLDVIFINKNSKVKECLYYGDISLLVISLIMLIFASNYFGLVCISLAFVQLLIKTLHTLLIKQK